MTQFYNNTIVLHTNSINIKTTEKNLLDALNENMLNVYTADKYLLLSNNYLNKIPYDIHESSLFYGDNGIICIKDVYNIFDLEVDSILIHQLSLENNNLENIYLKKGEKEKWKILNLN
nr:hypothetical protein [Fusobacterium gastrosuis]